MHAEARHHLVEDEHCAVASRESAEPGEEAVDRDDEPHVPGNGLDDHGRDLVAVLGEEAFDGLEVVVRRGQSVRDGAGRDAGRVGEAERRDAGARLHEQQVGMSVVAARELDDLRRAP